MADYASIKGNRVQYLDSDPTLSSANEGQVWYNNVTGALKGLVQIKAWSSGGNLNTARLASGGAGTQTAGLAFGGDVFPTSPRASTATEEYSGYTWSAGGNLANGRSSIAGCGTQTAGLGAGGYAFPGGSNSTEEYNGSAWTAGGTYPAATSGFTMVGLQTAALAFGAPNSTISYNGTSWTTLPATMNTARDSLAGAGTQTAAIGFGGESPIVASTESWNGTSWTSVNSMNTARTRLGGAGIQTSAIAFGGSTPTLSSATEQWDGTSWNTVPSLSTARNYIGSAGASISSAALAFGGSAPGKSAATEEYNSNIQVGVPATVSSGGNLNTARHQLGGFGVVTAAVAVAGTVPPFTNVTEEYNGTSWTNSNNLLTSKECFASGFGTQTAGALCGGNSLDNVPGQYSQSTHNYNGTSWTSSGNLNRTGLGRATVGTQTAGLGTGGYIGGGNFTDEVEHYDGSTWTTSTALPAVFDTYMTARAGSQTAAVYSVVGPPAAQTLYYDGTSWTQVASGVYPNSTLGSAAPSASGGTQTLFATMGPVATTEWNGTAWTNTGNISTPRNLSADGGNTSVAWLAGSGPAGPARISTEEYTYQGSPVTTSSTLTTS